MGKFNSIDDAAAGKFDRTRAPKSVPGDDYSPLLEYMKENHIPLTRQNYLDIRYMGKPPATLDPEVEYSLPRRFQLPETEVMTRTVAVTDFLTEDEIQLAARIWVLEDRTCYAKRVCDRIIRPNIERINAALGQENDPMRLAYAIEFVMTESIAKKQ